MNGRKNLLNQKKDTPYLPAGATVSYEAHVRKKTNRWYKIYLATTLNVVCLTVIFLLVGISERASLPNIV